MKIDKIAPDPFLKFVERIQLFKKEFLESKTITIQNLQNIQEEY